MRVFALGVVVLMTLCGQSDAQTRSRQFNDWYFLNGFSDLGGAAITVVEGFMKIRALNEEATADIVKSRERYWSQYPDGPGFEEAAKEYRRQLLLKDLHHLNPYFHEAGNAGAAAKFIYGERDGGIPVVARGKYFAWGALIREKTKSLRNRSLFDRLPTAENRRVLLQALRESSPVYAEYVFARNIAEFQEAGYDYPPHFCMLSRRSARRVSRPS